MNTQAPQNAFECDLQVRWSDQDLNGHVNNARVITLIEEARVLAGKSWSGTTPDGMTPKVVRKLDVSFDRAVEYGSALLGRVWVTRVNNTSYIVCHELLQENRRCAYAEAVIVILDHSTGRPTPVPESLRKNLLRFQQVDAESAAG